MAEKQKKGPQTRIENDKKKKNKNRGEECRSWERSTSPPCGTYKNVDY